MEIGNTSTILLNEAIKISNYVASTKWYLFGSLTRHLSFPNDVDLLIIYQKDEDRILLRECLKSLPKFPPVHLLLMNKDEAEETKFVQLQKAVKIFPLDTTEEKRQPK